MKVNNHKLLAISFALVLLGTLVIQAYWIYSVNAIKNEQFDDDVLNALHATVKVLEQRENVSFISDFQSDTLIKKGLKTSIESKNVHIIAQGGRKASKTYKYNYTEKRAPSQLLAESNKHVPQSVTRTIVISTDSLKLNLNEVGNEGSIEDKLSKIEVLIHKLAAGGDSLLKLPEGKEIEALLKANLRRHNVTLPFFIGLKVKGKETYASKQAVRDELYQSGYRINIFPNDVLKRQGELYVLFPDKTSFILSGMWGLMSVLLLFTLLLLFMFYTTLSNFKKQKKLNALKSDFINNMTHELKTPLATIQIASDLILKQNSDSENQVHKMAQTIKQQGKRIDEDVKNILQAALLENSKKIELHYSVFKLRDLLEEIRSGFALLAEEKKLHIELVCDENQQVEADKDLLKKACNNLLDNAIKYSSEGGEIKVEVTQSGSFAAISVKDQGSGIAKEDLPYVFERFYRSGKGNLHHNKGYGLGLSFVKKIVELHQGKIELKSESEQGTLITIHIPNEK